LKIVVGLGNPGASYARTKHNVGFWVVDRLAQSLNADMSRSKFQAHYAESTVQSEKIVLLKPHTYMNLSGQAVREAVDWYKCVAQDVIVVYDDMDLPAGSLRLRSKGSAGGHNGMKSLIQHLGGSDFPRVRIGVGRPEASRIVIDHVLSPFSKEDKAQVDQAVERAHDAILLACRESFDLAMNRFNGE